MGWINRWGRYSAKEAVERGRTRIGEEYVWGTWDCSKFVSWCYFGDSIRWTTSTMQSIDPSPYGFTRIPIGSVGSFKAGDILYYDTGDPHNSHTGMATGPFSMIQNGGGADAVWQHIGLGGAWEAILRPKDGLYIVHWTPSDGLGGGF